MSSANIEFCTLNAEHFFGENRMQSINRRQFAAAAASLTYAAPAILGAQRVKNITLP
jgi:hypothetical protein